MPQLDTLIFFNQFFWFFSSFLFIYYFFGYIVIPELNFYYFVKYNILEAVSEFEFNFDFNSTNCILFGQNKSEVDLVNAVITAWISSSNAFYFRNFSATSKKFDNSIATINSKLVSLLLLDIKIF